MVKRKNQLNILDSYSDLKFESMPRQRYIFPTNFSPFGERGQNFFPHLGKFLKRAYNAYKTHGHIIKPLLCLVEMKRVPGSGSGITRMF